MSPSYQVVDLVVPATGHKDHLACLLRELQGRAALPTPGVQVAVEECGRGHVIGQTSVVIPQGFFLPRREEEPLFPPTDVGRPAEGAEDVGMER